MVEFPNHLCQYVCLRSICLPYVGYLHYSSKKPMGFTYGRVILFFLLQHSKAHDLITQVQYV